MKKYIIGLIVVFAVSISVYAGFRIDYNTSDRYSVVDSAGNVMFYIDDAGTTGDAAITRNLSVSGASTLTGAVTAPAGITGSVSGSVSSASSVSFSVTTDTNTVPTAAGQVIMDDQYNLFISTAIGGSWYEISRSTTAGTLGQ